MINYQQLNNGIRVVHQQTKSEVAHLVVMINVGSRNELINESGIAHFVEHVIFKGTHKRKLHQVLGRLENVGADLNAFTAKEETCIHASFQKKHYKRAIELFADIIFNSTFPEKEIEKEKDVVIDEIYACEDNPSEAIFDKFESLIFDGHPLANPILGSPKLVKKISRSKIKDFISNNYSTDKIVISSVGNINFTVLLKYILMFFNVSNSLETLTYLNRPVVYSPFVKTIKKNINQTHTIIGGVAYNSAHKNRIALSLLINILGGPSMNSRLALLLREKNGISYNIEASYTAYAESGIFAIYLGTDNNTSKKAITLVENELKKITNTPLTLSQLKTAKNQIIGQLLISYESNLNNAIAIAKNILTHNKPITFEDIINDINDLTIENLNSVANEIFNLNKLSYLTFTR